MGAKRVVVTSESAADPPAAAAVGGGTAPPRKWIRLAQGRAGGYVNRLARGVQPGEAVEAPAEIADWLIGRGDFEAVEDRL